MPLSPISARQGLQAILVPLLVCTTVASAAQAASPPSVPTATPVAAAPTLTVDQLVQRILEANPDVAVAAVEIAAAQAALTTAQALPNPRIDWEQGRQRPLVAAPGVQGATQQLTWVQPLENPWLRAARQGVASAGIEVAQGRQLQTRNDVAAQIRTLALELVLRQEETEVFAESLALLEQVRERILRRVESGEAPRYDLIKADAELVSARQRLVQSRLMAERVQTTLNRLAAGRLPARWALERPAVVDSLERLDVGALGAEAAPIHRNPELAALEAQVQQAQRSVEQAQASILPSVDLMAGRGREPDLRANTVGLSVMVPVFDRRQGPIAEARALRLRAQTQRDGRLAQIQQEWRIAQQSFEMARARAAGLSQGAIREAEAAVRVAEAAWRFGERGILDVLDAQRVLRALRADLIQARFEAAAARIELDRLEGRSVR